MRRLLRLLIAAAVALLLCGASCGQARPAPVAQTVVLPVSKFRALDPALTAPCGPKAVGPLSAILDVAAARGAQVEDCDQRMSEIRALQPVVEDRADP